MLLGLLSDTHDRIDTARAAIKLLRDNDAQYLLHAGDICGSPIIDLLTGGPAALVWGNNDFDRPILSRYCADVGVHCLDESGTLEFDGKRLAITHGDDPKRVKRLLLDHDYLITGHTHVAHDRWQGRCRWINPGALCRATVKSVALLDTTSDTLRTLRVK